MLILITGGSASGKSEIAERICMRFGKKLCYIATMIPYGEEAQPRIERHRKMRSGRGFMTYECYGQLEEAKLPIKGGSVLLECMGNLVANELFEYATPPEELTQRIMLGIDVLLGQAQHVTVVTNEIFGGVERYADGMAMYLRCLGDVNRELAERADTVIEAVCGLPVFCKGREVAY